MAMSAGGDPTQEKPMSDINTTPLVDVMLVLLIVFLIAVPVVIQSVQLKLPDIIFDPTATKPENVLLSIRENPKSAGECEVFLGMTKIGHDDLLKTGAAKLQAVVDKVRREHHARRHPRGPHPRRPEHPVSLHRRGDLHDADGGLSPRRLHLAAAGGHRRGADVIALLKSLRSIISWQ